MFRRGFDDHHKEKRSIRGEPLMLLTLNNCHYIVKTPSHRKAGPAALIMLLRAEYFIINNTWSGDEQRIRFILLTIKI